jgi:NADH:ubiquinone oxidoreductase subunit 5 (subunit L)/multisubunit Na+/H+ antiporter MnhA subunit
VLLCGVAAVGCAGVAGLAWLRFRGGARAPLAFALLLQAAVVVAVCAERTSHVIGAVVVAGLLATLAPLGAAPSLVDGRSALRAFVLHRTGDAALLVALGALTASFHGTGLDMLLDVAPTTEPWSRLDEGVGALLAGTPHRTLWFLAGAGVAVGAGTRLGLLAFPLATGLTATPRLAPPLAGLVHALGLHGAGVVLLVRLHPVLALAPEAMDGLVVAGTATVVACGVLALCARDLLRVDALLLPGHAGVVAVLAGCGDVTGVVLGGLLLLAAATTLPWTAALVVEATGERDPVALQGLERRLPRTHTTRLLTTAALLLPPLGGWVVVERALEATALSTRVAAGTVVALAVGVVLLSTAAWRTVHRVFNGNPVEKGAGRTPREPGLAGQGGALLLAFIAPGLSLLAIPRGLLLLLPGSFEHESPLAAFCDPALQETAAVRSLFAARLAAPPVAPSTFALLVVALGVLPWLLSWALFRGSARGRPPPLAGLLTWRPVAAAAVRLAAWVGRDTRVARTVGEGVEVLSRVVAAHFIPAVLTFVLQRLPAFAAGAAAFVVRGTQTGAAPHAIVLALVVAAWLAWRAVKGG